MSRPFFSVCHCLKDASKLWPYSSQAWPWNSPAGLFLDLWRMPQVHPIASWKSCNEFHKATVESTKISLILSKYVLYALECRWQFNYRLCLARCSCAVAPFFTSNHLPSVVFFTALWVSWAQSHFFLAAEKAWSLYLTGYCFWNLGIKHHHHPWYNFPKSGVTLHVESADLRKLNSYLCTESWGPVINLTGSVDVSCYALLLFEYNFTFL